MLLLLQAVHDPTACDPSCNRIGDAKQVQRANRIGDAKQVQRAIYDTSRATHVTSRATNVNKRRTLTPNTGDWCPLHRC